MASPQFPADVPATHPASSAQARNPVSPAVAADYENLTGLYQKLIDSPDASSPAPEPLELPVPVFKVRKKAAGSSPPEGGCVERLRKRCRRVMTVITEWWGSGPIVTPCGPKVAVG